MGYRLSKIYTKTGDKGTTGLADNTRVSKDDLRVETYGTLDELNSFIGLLLSEPTLPKQIEATLTLIQHQLFDLGSEFCLPNYIAIQPEHITHLEKTLDELNEALPPLKEFILPGGCHAAAICHIARTVCRRAERHVVSLMKTTEINPQSLIYLNRLSDLLFVMARFINQTLNVHECLWDHEK